MAESSDALIDIYLSDQWRIHGGPRKKPAREELRDRVISLVVKAFGSVESSLDVLLKESPCSNGHGVNNLIRAYELYFLRRPREAVEAGDQAAEQCFADLQGQFNELEEYEKNLIGSAEPQDNERIHATLRTSVCNLPKPRPAASTVLDLFQEDASARPLGDNPFPEPGVPQGSTPLTPAWFRCYPVRQNDTVAACKPYQVCFRDLSLTITLSITHSLLLEPKAAKDLTNPVNR
jgi:hypothetical protein